ENELSALGDRLEPRPTQPVHGDGRDPNRQSRLEPDVTGAVDRVGGRLEGVAEDAVAHVGGRNARALERVLCGDGAELDRREVLQGAPEGAEAGPDTREEHHICIGTLGLHWGEAPRETRGISGGSGEGGRARPPDAVETEAAARPCRSSGQVRPVYGQTPSREFTRAHDGGATSIRRTLALPSPRCRARSTPAPAARRWYSRRSPRRRR